MLLRCRKNILYIIFIFCLTSKVVLSEDNLELNNNLQSNKQIQKEANETIKQISNKDVNNKQGQEKIIVSERYLQKQKENNMIIDEYFGIFHFVNFSMGIGESLGLLKRHHIYQDNAYIPFNGLFIYFSLFGKINKHFNPFVRFNFFLNFSFSRKLNDYIKDELKKEGELARMEIYDFDVGNRFVLSNNNYSSHSINLFGTVGFYKNPKNCKKTEKQIINGREHNVCVEEYNSPMAVTENGVIVGAGIGYVVNVSRFIDIEVDFKYKYLIHTKGTIPFNVEKNNSILSIDLSLGCFMS